MVLPGAQALLGFQFVTMVLDDFDRLPVLLMAPAAHPRIVEQGANTEAFHRLAGRFIIWSMVPLALGITGDFYVVLRKVTGSVALAATSAAGLLAASYGFWFGYTFYQRSQFSREA